MTKLEELIQELCPDGVEYVELSELLVKTSSGLNPRNNFKLNTNDAKNYYVTVKEIVSGSIVFSDKTDLINDEAMSVIQNRSNLEVDDVLLSGIGTIGKVALVDIPIDNWNCSESVILLKPKKEIILPKYLKYILESGSVQEYFNKKATGSTLKGIRQKDLQKLRVPLVPLPIQREIVHILDNFTLLSAELSAELSARKQQYAYYRDYLLNFETEEPVVEWKKIGDIATDIYRGAGIKRDEVTETGTPCVRYGEIYTAYNVLFDECISHTDESKLTSKKYFEHGDILFAITGESVEEIAKSCAYMGNERCLAGGDIVVLKHEQNPKYLAYALSTTNAQIQKSKGKVKSKVVHSSVPSICEIVVPIPPLDVQESIANQIEKFDKLATDISDGLPAEIEVRKKQYEYYRDAILSFDCSQIVKVERERERANTQ